jgi:hypothetical protein
MAKVPDNAKTALLEQQISLLDMIVEENPEGSIEWKKYVESAFPEFFIIDGKAKKEDQTNISLKYMRCFRDSVFSGITPSATILAHIAEAFDKYLNSGLDLELEQCFSLSSKPNIGSPIAQEYWVHDKATVLFAMKIKRKIAKLKEQRLSIENAAASVIEDWNLEADAEALKKYYISNGIDKQTWPTLPETVFDLEKAYYLAAVMYAAREKLPDLSIPDKKAFESFLKNALEKLGNK